MFQLFLIMFFLSSSILLSKDFFLNPIVKQGKNLSNKKSFQIAKNTEDFGDEDEDDEEISASTVSNKSSKTTKGSKQPSIPTTSNEWKQIGTEIDPAKRKQLIEQGIATLRSLEEKNTPSSIKQISRYLLNYPIPEVRAEAANILGKLGKGTKALHKAIDTDGYEVRQEAYKAIERIGARASLKYFIKGTQSTDPEIRIASYKGLGKTRSSIGRDIILKTGISSQEPNIVSASLIGLGYYSRKEDIEIFKKFLQSEVTEHKAGAIQGLGVSKLPGTISLLLFTLESNPNMEPEVIHAISQKKTLAGTLTLIKLLQATKNENYQAIIQKELYLRKAFGNYAIVKTNTASIRKYSRASANKVGILKKGEVARIKKVTEKLFKAKMNGEILEDRYYLVQAVNENEISKKQIIEGWVFGPKINIINLTNPAKTVVSRSTKPIKGKEVENFMDEDSEDEASSTDPEINNPPPVKKETGEEFYDEDEDE